MNTTHTPGPWRIGKIMQYGGYDCTTAGLMIGPVYLSGFEYGQERCGEISDYVCQRMLTDAALIAAAPDMYEALKAVFDMQAKHYGNATDTHMHLSIIIKQVSAALAKACRQ